MEIADSFEGRSCGGAASQSLSESQKTEIVAEEVYTNRIGDLAAFVPRSRKRRERSPSPSPEPVHHSDYTMEQPPSQPTQQATQPFEDPRRLGKNVSDVSDNDLSDVICILHPNSPAAFEAVRATLLVAHQHILQNDDLVGVTEDDLDLDPALNRTRDLALRMSSNVKNMQSGFTFGRNRQHSDILLVPDPQDKNVSNIHFKIFVNSQGSLMLQDTSTNGTVVDDDHLRCKDRAGRQMQKPATVALRNGSILCVVGPNKAEIKLMVRIPNRGDYEDIYEDKLRNYLAARGKVAHFASMRESAFGNHWNGGILYNFVGCLGKGAFATVYRVQTKKEGDVLAAKELDKRRFIKNGVLDIKVDSELRIMQQLRHPNIVEYVDHHDYEQWIYIMMEYVPFGELSKELERNGPLPESTVQIITRQILHALRYLHQRNITHRDIKPDNILIASRDPLIVKLSDFGLSKCVKNQETFLKTFCGTLLYCAPEIYPDYGNYQRGVLPKRRRVGEPTPRNSPYDSSVDMWSFGAVLFHILCGKAPIMGRGDDKGAQMLNNIMTKDVDFSPLRNLRVSEDAIDFVSRLMNRNPQLRPKEDECFQHSWIRDVKDAFDYVQDDAPIPLQQELEVVEEVEEDGYDDEEAAVFDAVRDLEEITTNTTRPDARFQQEQRPFKRARTTANGAGGTVLYPILPVADMQATGQPPAAPPPPRLFGEIGQSVLRSSGVFGQAFVGNLTDVRDIRNRVEQISVNDFVSVGCDQSMDLDPGSAASLYGAEVQIGQLNMASPENAASEDAPTPDTTNPVTPLTREMSPTSIHAETYDNEAASFANEDEVLQGEDSLHASPKFNRKIDLDLLKDQEAFKASLDARNASRAQKILAKATTFQAPSNRVRRAPSIELAKTIDAHTGQEVFIQQTRPLRMDRTISPQQLSRPIMPLPQAQIRSPVGRLGKLISLPGSIANLEIDICSRIMNWGRGVDCTVPYADKKDTRIPKYAIKLTFWAPGVEEFIDGGGDWTKMEGIRTVISTSASQCIWVNNVQLRKESPDGDAALYGKVYSGDVVTVFNTSNDRGPFLKFRLEFSFGDSARHRPETEKGFHIQIETYHHQRVMKERESMRMSGQADGMDESDLADTRAVTMV